MTKYEEAYLISSLLSLANPDNSIDLNNEDIWNSLFLNEDTNIHEDYFFELNAKGFLYYEELGDDGFAPIRICSIIPNNTKKYLKNIIYGLEASNAHQQQQVDLLNKRINEILTFDPNKLSSEIQTTENIIRDTQHQINSNPILQPLSVPLDKIALHFNSLRKVADNYEEVYKNIILPVKEEGKSGIRQTVRWAIISVCSR
jgi:hypothetical protein